MHLTFLGAFAGQFLNTLQFLAFMLTAKNLFLHRLGDLGMLVQVVVEFLLEEVADEDAHTLPFGSHREGPQLGLGL